MSKFKSTINKIIKSLTENKKIRHFDTDFSNISDSVYLYFYYDIDDENRENIAIRVSEHALPRHHGYYEFNANSFDWIDVVEAICEKYGLNTPKTIIKERAKIEQKKIEQEKRTEEFNKKQKEYAEKRELFFDAFKVWRKSNKLKSTKENLEIFKKIYGER